MASAIGITRDANRGGGRCVICWLNGWAGNRRRHCVFSYTPSPTPEPMLFLSRDGKCKSCLKKCYTLHCVDHACPDPRGRDSAPQPASQSTVELCPAVTTEHTGIRGWERRSWGNRASHQRSFLLSRPQTQNKIRLTCTQGSHAESKGQRRKHNSPTQK